MNSRLDRQADQSLVDTVARLRSDFNDLKQRQPSRAETAYLSSTASPWDYNAATPSGSGSMGFLMTWVSDGSQPFPLFNPSLDVFADGTDAAHKLNPLRQTTVGINIDSLHMLEDQTLYGSQTTMTWTTYIDYSGVHQLYMKARVMASCPGTVSLVRFV